MRTRAVIVGIGGASCSGKTLLAKHLAALLPSASLLHQDDFAPSIENVPFSPKHGVQDWDDPPTCVEWPRMRSALASIHANAKLPDGHSSNDHLNKQAEVAVDLDVAQEWQLKLAKATEEAEAQGTKLVWFIVDGFVLYWDPEVSKALDVKILLRVPRETLKARREGRSYALQNVQDAEAGGVWDDPPHYFDNIVYPAYVKAHESIFEGGDVEQGRIKPKDGEQITLLTPTEGPNGVTRVLDETCSAVLDAINKFSH